MGRSSNRCRQVGNDWGIEANPDAVAAATARGIDVVASDLGDPSDALPTGGEGQTRDGYRRARSACADLRMAMLWALELLSGDGLMLFEVPVLRGDRT